jgi:hypothetical protein
VGKLSSSDARVSEVLNPQLRRCENVTSFRRIMADVCNKTIVLFALAAVLQHYLDTDVHVATNVF